MIKSNQGRYTYFVVVLARSSGDEFDRLRTDSSSAATFKKLLCKFELDELRRKKPMIESLNKILFYLSVITPVGFGILYLYEIGARV